MTADFSAMRECPSPQNLMQLAVAQTGQDDFGDAGRNEGLIPYVASINEDSWAGMTPKARELAVDYLVHQLSVRLKLIQDRKTHAEIANQTIKAPLIVVGPPRSGSTLLHNLIRLDPDNMAPEHWLCREPSPPLAMGAPSASTLR